MRLSLVVGLYNTHREVPRTLLTMSPAMQGLAGDDYEIILVDNGSSTPLDEAELQHIAENCRYVRIEHARPSPTEAINNAVLTATGDLITVVIDGARMFSPGVLSRTLQAFDLFDDPFVYAPSLHLGPQLQNDSAYGGYDQQVEDALLDTVPWQQDGYKLFDICNIDTVPERLLRPTFESNCFTIRRATWDRVGGYHSGFADSVGGGVANWELFARYMNDEPITPVLLVGEATFHQFHGGASTNQPRAGHPIRTWLQEHRDIVGAPYTWPDYEPVVLGSMRSELADSLFDRNVSTRVTILRELSAAGEHDAAVAVGRQLCRRHPNDPGKLQVLAEALEIASRRAEALDVIDSALKIAPTQAELHITKAVVHVGLDQLATARTSFDQAIELDDLLAEAFFHRGHLEMREGRYEHAVRDFERALALEPKPPPNFSADLATARAHLVDGAPDPEPPTRVAIDVAAILTEFIQSVHRHYGPELDNATIEEHARDGSFSPLELQALIRLVNDAQPRRILVVGGFLGLSTRVLADATQSLGSTIVSIDPNLRHRAFSAPLDHARTFAVSDRVRFIDGFFGERTGGGTRYDLREYAPRLPETEAERAVNQTAVVTPSGDFDLVLIDADGGTEVALVAAALPLLAASATLVLVGHHARLAELLAPGATDAAEIVPVAHAAGFTAIAVAAPT